MSGFFGPQQIDIDPTAEALRPIRDLLGRAFSQRFGSGAPLNRSPFNNLDNPVLQLFPRSGLNQRQRGTGFGNQIPPPPQDRDENDPNGRDDQDDDFDLDTANFVAPTGLPGSNVLGQRGPFGDAPLGQAQGPFQTPDIDGVISDGSRIINSFQPQFGQPNQFDRLGPPGDFGSGSSGFDPGQGGIDPNSDPFNLTQFGGPFSAPLTGGQLDSLSGLRQLFDPSRLVQTDQIQNAISRGLSGDPAFSPGGGQTFDQAVRPFRTASATSPFFSQIFGGGVPEVESIVGQRGATGAQGVAGGQGVAGVQGAQGDQGLRGFQGVEGQQGLEGATGLLGLQGEQGLQGIEGLQGIMGLLGLQGVEGQIGLQGLPGVAGELGLTGAQGAQGIAGLIGQQGAQGIQGLQGEQGVAGALGLPGAQGLPGLTIQDLFRNNDPQFLATGGQIDEHVDTIVGEAGPELIPAGTNTVVPLQSAPVLGAGAITPQDASFTPVGPQLIPQGTAPTPQVLPPPPTAIPGDIAAPQPQVALAQQQSVAGAPQPGASFDDFLTPVLGDFQSSLQTALGAPRFDLTETFQLGQDVFESDLDQLLARTKEEASRFGLNPGSSDRSTALTNAGATALSRFRLSQQDIARQSFESAENRRLGAIGSGPQAAAFLDTPFDRQIQSLPFLQRQEQQDVENFFRNQENAQAIRQNTLSLLPQFNQQPFDQAQQLFGVEGQARNIADQDIQRRQQEFARTQGGGLNQILAALSGTPLQNTQFGPSGFSQFSDLLGAIGSFFGG